MNAARSASGVLNSSRSTPSSWNSATVPWPRLQAATAIALRASRKLRSRLGGARAERGEPLHEGAASRHVAGNELFEADGLEAPIGLGDGAALDQPKGRDGGRVIERLELVVAKISGMPECDDAAVPLGPNA